MKETPGLRCLEHGLAVFVWPAVELHLWPLHSCIFDTTVLKIHKYLQHHGQGSSMLGELCVDASHETRTADTALPKPHRKVCSG